MVPNEQCLQNNYQSNEALILLNHQQTAIFPTMLKVQTLDHSPSYFCQLLILFHGLAYHIHIQENYFCNLVVQF